MRLTLRKRAQYCHDLADGARDRQTMQLLRQIADDFENEADRLDGIEVGQRSESAGLPTYRNDRENL